MYFIFIGFTWKVGPWSGKKLDMGIIFWLNMWLKFNGTVLIMTAHRPLARYAHAPGMPGSFFPRYRLQTEPLVTDPGMHQGTCVMHVPWCMSGSLTRGGGENVPGFPGACTTLNFTFLARGPCIRVVLLQLYGSHSDRVIIIMIHIPGKMVFILERSPDELMLYPKHRFVLCSIHVCT